MSAAGYDRLSEHGAGKLIMGTPAGWYANGEHWETYWDGSSWTDQHRPRATTVPQPVADSATAEETPAEADLQAGDGKTEPLLAFVSHIEGKNARVYVWPDRVEWDRKGFLSTGAKTGMAVATVGLSYFATGFTRKQSTEVIPVKSIMSVTTKRGMGFQTKLQVITSGNTIDMRIAHKEAEQVRTVLMQLISGSHPSQPQLSEAAVPSFAAASVSSSPDIAAQLTQLASLRDAGILTEDEFKAKKTELLSRL
ncbi:SHOCT domain-containing protein [Microbacterium binotii]|uniref:SHOCT domain-containing protein n=1 Tax=Microbacterium binotii TaxID=462710 RepID=UPI001F281BDD|nr:SHOCT domain-containing protein [Microbacterium binotii]UIN31887.1 SHOCT domain-containing protein [Microbacterium binotii]